MRRYEYIASNGEEEKFAQRFAGETWKIKAYVEEKF
jgi:hypothetical protein